MSSLKEICGALKNFVPQNQMLQLSCYLQCKGCEKILKKVEEVSQLPIITCSDTIKQRLISCLTDIEHVKRSFLKSPFCCEGKHDQICSLCGPHEVLSSCETYCQVYQVERHIGFYDEKGNNILPQTLFMEIPVHIEYKERVVRRTGRLSMDKCDLLLLRRKSLDEEGISSSTAEIHTYKPVSVVVVECNNIEVACRYDKEKVTFFGNEEKEIPKKEFWSKYANSVKYIHFEKDDLPIKGNKSNDNAIIEFFMLHKKLFQNIYSNLLTYNMIDLAEYFNQCSAVVMAIKSLAMSTNLNQIKQMVLNSIESSAGEPRKNISKFLNDIPKVRQDDKNKK